jgi:hypothetical protein
LSGVAHGPHGWLAVGAPGPVLLASSDGTNWRRLTGPGTQDLAVAPDITAAANADGYIIAGKGTGGGGTPDIWWSRDLRAWTRASSMNFTTGSSRVLAAAADAHGFLAVGSHDNQPTVWSTSDGSSWTAIPLGLPAGASAAVLQQVAVNGDRVVTFGEQRRQAGGTVPFAELAVNSGASWQVVPFTAPGPGTVITALSAGPGDGFTAAAQYAAAQNGVPGQQVAVWTSASGSAWTRAQVSGLTGDGISEMAALVPSGPANSSVTGIGITAVQSGQHPVTVTLPAVP